VSSATGSPTASPPADGAPVGGAAARVTTIPRPDEPVPAFPRPTIALWIGALVVYGASTALAVTDAWPWWISTLVNGVAAFVLFTVAHEASHTAASSQAAVNRWLGRLSLPFFTPLASHGVFRFIHMQHHRFTNHEDGSDPDHWTQRGPAVLLPLRWLTVDLHYVRFYLGRIGSRPAAEKRETLLSFVLVVGLLVVLALTGHAFEVLVLYLVPGRIAVAILAWSFDWLPHHGLRDTPRSDRYRTTRNIVGLERLLTPLMLYQNYHLVHHLHPVIPFYRYIAVWRRNEAAYLDRDPAMATPLGRPVTAEERRRLLELDHHH
jgi:ring-1,2-phenylacetyl-CoA epoxidase subunit PaaE